MTAGILDVCAGAAVWFEGDTWEVESITAEAARMRRGTTIRCVSIGSLLATGAPIQATGVTAADRHDDLFAIPTVVLSALSPAQRHVLTTRLAELRPLLEPGEGGGLVERLHTRARELGVSARTLERRLARYEERGPAGLVDARLLKEVRRSVDPRWDTACREALDSYRNASNPTKKTVISRANRAFLAAVPDGRLPSLRVAYRRLDELDRGRYTFGISKQRRSVAERPAGQLGRLVATRPGEYLILDGYRLDVFAMEPITHRWVNTELTVAMDLYDRSIKGLRLRPIAAKSADVANVLFQAMTPQQWGYRPDASHGPYGGVPEHLIVGDIAILPETLVVDHGKVYLSEHTASVCQRLGLSIQPATPHKPTDKPTLERFFRTLRQGLLDQLSGYKGPDIASRGKDVEKTAFYYVSELEQIIREWVGDVYHQTPHSGLPNPANPRDHLTPAEMFARGIAQSGRLRLPARQDLYFDFLQVQWRTIQHYGVEIDGQRYDGAGLNLYRGTRSPYGGRHAGKWPFLVDVDDVRHVYFKDPVDATWHQLVWDHAADLTAPFSRDAAAYTRALAVRENRHVDVGQAVNDLLSRWGEQKVTDRRERNLALRLSAQRPGLPAGDTVHDAASAPAVIDFLAQRAKRADLQADDDLDVFERYYAEHPDQGALEVFED